MNAPRPSCDRIAAAVLVAVLHAGALWLLLHARGAALPTQPRTSLASFNVALPPPPPPPPAPAAAAAHPAAPRGAAGRVARRTPVVAPSPVVSPPPAPVVAAIVPDTGNANVGGAAAAGAGTGAGTSGGGSGAGGVGDGTGGGTRARLTGGAIRNRDYPKAERAAQVQGVVTVAFTVGTDGRAHGCRVARSSGSAALDAVTCRLIEQRFRYAPARDVAGRAVAEERSWRQRWWIADPPGD